MITRNEMEVALLAVMAASSTGTALGVVPLPGSLEDTPSIFGQTAAIVLWLGCLVGLFGIGWANRLDGLVIEQVGLLAVALGSGMYALALTLGGSRWSDIALAFGMSLGVCVAAGVRHWRIYRYRRALQEFSAKGVANGKP